MEPVNDLVDVRDLRIVYGKTVAVSGLTFAIPKGDVFGFIGPNGAGKTSTIKVLATLLRPGGGSVRIGGIDLRKDPRSIRRIIGYMPDEMGVYEDLTAREYLHFFAAAYSIDTAAREGLIHDVLALTDLTGKKDSRVDALSRGMKQRLALARVLLHDPELLLLDEPASGLDPRARIDMRELLKELKIMGKTILVSSHILHELSQICTRIGIIEAGRLVAEGPLDDIYRRHGVRRFIHVRITNLGDDLVDRIRGIPGVDSVENAPDRLILQIREQELSVEDLHDKLCGLGARIHMFQPEALDMETVFMKLTQGKVS